MPDELQQLNEALAWCAGHSAIVWFYDRALMPHVTVSIGYVPPVERRSFLEAVEACKAEIQRRLDKD